MKRFTMPCLFGVFLSAFGLLKAQGPVEVSMAGDTIATGSAVEFKLKFENKTSGNLDRLVYAYRIGEGKVDSLTVAFSSPLASGKSSSQTFVFAMENAVYGENTLQMWCAQMNDSTILPANFDTVDLAFTYYDSTLVSRFNPLLEMFSSSNCSNCAPYNTAVSPGIEELVAAGLLNVVKYQINSPVVDPYSTTAGNNRMKFYGVSGAPTSIYCGTQSMISWAEWPEFESMLNELRYKVYSEAGALRMVNVNLIDFTIDTTDHYLNLEFNLGAMKDMSVLVNAVVVEKLTTKNAAGNGEKEFHWVTMDIPTNQGNGLSLALKANQKTENFHFQVELQKTHAEEDSDLQVVFIIQNTNGQAVYQSLRFQPQFGDVVYDPALSVEAPSSSVEFQLYPNPVKEQLYLGGLTMAEVSVFDLSGRCVIPARRYEAGNALSVTDLVPGVYVLRVVQEGKTGVRRFSVVR